MSYKFVFWRYEEQDDKRHDEEGTRVGGVCAEKKGRNARKGEATEKRKMKGEQKPGLRGTVTFPRPPNLRLAG